MTAVRNIGIPGFISGGLKFNTTATPPTVSAGLYDVGGEMVQLPADVALSTSDVLGQCRTAFDSFIHCLMVMDRTGACRWLPYGEGLVSGATGTITSITGAGTSKTLTVATGTVGSHTGKILAIYGNDGFLVSTHKITGGNGSSTYTFEGPSVTVGGASGTWAVYERTKTLHGTGSSAAITTDADVLKYTPSYGENGWDAGIAAFDPIKNGYYLTISGYTGWRVIGNFRLNTSSQPVTDIVSHKSGRDKNDNDFNVFQDAGLGSTSTTVQRFSSIDRVFGCDYVLVPNSSTDGCVLTVKRSGLFTGSHTGGTSGSSPFLGIFVNSTSYLTVSPNNIPTSLRIGGIAQPAVSYMESVFGSKYVSAGDTIRPQATTQGSYIPALTAFQGNLIL